MEIAVALWVSTWPRGDRKSISYLEFENLFRPVHTAFTHLQPSLNSFPKIRLKLGSGFCLGDASRKCGNLSQKAALFRDVDHCL